MHHQTDLYGAVFGFHGGFPDGKDRYGCGKERQSRSEWIGEACAAKLSPGSGATLLPSATPVLGKDDHNIGDYDETYRNFRIDVPEYFNFGFDVIDAWAYKDRNKLAMIWVNQEGVEKKFTFWDLMRLSNQIVNMLIKYGVNKGDTALIMLPRVPSGGPRPSP